jgi:hypothetical protein
MLKINIVYGSLSFISTESERRYSNCSLLRTEDGRKPHGIGYSSLKQKITTDALWGGIYRVYILHRLRKELIWKLRTAQTYF